MHPLRSQGRAVLAVNARPLRGVHGVHRCSAASGSDDPRVLYPLLAAGHGHRHRRRAARRRRVGRHDRRRVVPLGGRLVGRDVGVPHRRGQRPAAVRRPLLVGRRRRAHRRWASRTFALTRATMDDGDATLAHSGGALGPAPRRRDAAPLPGRDAGEARPYTRDGLRRRHRPRRGGRARDAGDAVALARAAHRRGRRRRRAARRGGGEPAHLPEHHQSEHTRGWLSATLGGSILGGGLAWWLTRDSAPKLSWLPPGYPTVGVIGESASPARQPTDLRRRLGRHRCDDVSRSTLPDPHVLPRLGRWSTRSSTEASAGA